MYITALFVETIIKDIKSQITQYQGYFKLIRTKWLVIKMQYGSMHV